MASTVFLSKIAKLEEVRAVGEHYLQDDGTFDGPGKTTIFIDADIHAFELSHLIRRNTCTIGVSTYAAPSLLDMQLSQPPLQLAEHFRAQAGTAWQMKSLTFRMASP